MLLILKALHLARDRVYNDRQSRVPSLSQYAFAKLHVYSATLIKFWLGHTGRDMFCTTRQKATCNFAKQWQSVLVWASSFRLKSPLLD